MNKVMDEFNFENMVEYLNDFVFLSQFKKLKKYEQFDYICNKNQQELNELKDKNGNTLLHLVIKYKNIKLTKVLLKYWVNLDEKNFLGETALYYAVKKLDKEHVKLLLENKCNPLIKNNKELSVIELLKIKNQQATLEFNSLKYKDNNVAFCYSQQKLLIKLIFSKINFFSKKYWPDIELKELKQVSMSEVTDVVKMIDEINSASLFDPQPSTSHTPSSSKM